MVRKSRITNFVPEHFVLLTRGSVRSTRGLGPTMTARGQSIGISTGMLPQTLIMSITVQKISKHYTTEFDLEEGFLNGACISVSNLPENIAWQTHRPEARGPLKSGAWGGRPTCHPQTLPLYSIMCLHFREFNLFLFLLFSSPYYSTSSAPTHLPLISFVLLSICVRWPKYSNIFACTKHICSV